jgi:P27 family predicted phage terminase small subunit
MSDCYSQFRTAQAVLKKEGLTFKTPNGYVQQRPEVAIANKAKEQLRMFFSEFGMNAASRTRVSGNGAGGGGDGEDWSGTGLDR